MGSSLAKEKKKPAPQAYSIEAARKIAAMGLLNDKAVLLQGAEEETPLTKILKENVPGLKYYSQKEPLEEDFKILWNLIGELMPKKKTTSTGMSLLPKKGSNNAHQRQNSVGGVMMKMDVFYARLWEINPDAVIHSKNLHVRTKFFIDVIHAVPATTSFISDCKRFARVYGAAGLMAREFGSIGESLMHTFVKHTDSENEVTWDLSELRLLKAWERAYSRFLRYIVPTLLLNDTQKAPQPIYKSISPSFKDDEENDYFPADIVSVKTKQTISLLRREYSNLDLNETEDRVSDSGVLIPGSSKKLPTLMSRMNSMVAASSRNLLAQGGEDSGGSGGSQAAPTFLSRMSSKMKGAGSQSTILVGDGGEGNHSNNSNNTNNSNNSNNSNSSNNSNDPNSKTPDSQKAKGRFTANEAPLVEDEDPCSPGRCNISHKPSNVNAVDSLKNNINSNDSGRDSEFSPDLSKRSSVKKGFTSTTNATTQKVLPGIIGDTASSGVDHDEDTADGDVPTATATAIVVNESSFRDESSTGTSSTTTIKKTVTTKTVITTTVTTTTAASL